MSSQSVPDEIRGKYLSTEEDGTEPGSTCWQTCGRGRVKGSLLNIKDITYREVGEEDHEAIRGEKGIVGGVTTFPVPRIRCTIHRPHTRLKNTRVFTMRGCMLSKKERKILPESTHITQRENSFKKKSFKNT